MVDIFSFLKKKKHGEFILRCPRCRVRMDKIKKNDVILDICRKCGGMWLDDSEIHKLVAMSKGEKKDGKKR